VHDQVRGVMHEGGRARAGAHERAQGHGGAQGGLSLSQLLPVRVHPGVLQGAQLQGSQVDAHATLAHPLLVRAGLQGGLCQLRRVDVRNNIVYDII
jgi:hypothetical protein